MICDTREDTFQASVFSGSVFSGTNGVAADTVPKIGSAGRAEI